MRGSVWLTTNLKVMVVRRRMKESWRRFWGSSSSTVNVPNARLQMNNCKKECEPRPYLTLCVSIRLDVIIDVVVHIHHLTMTRKMFHM